MDALTSPVEPAKRLLSQQEYTELCDLTGDLVQVVVRSKASPGMAVAAAKGLLVWAEMVTGQSDAER